MDRRPQWDWNRLVAVVRKGQVATVGHGKEAMMRQGQVGDRGGTGRNGGTGMDWWP